MNAMDRPRRRPDALLRAAVMGTVALGLLAACDDGTEVSQAPVADEPVAEQPIAGEEPTAAVAPATPPAPEEDGLAVAPESGPPGQPLDPEAFAGEARNAIGTPFRTASGDTVGEVTDVLRDGDERPEALIVTLDGNDRMVQVPLDQVRVRPGERELLAAGDAEQIRGLPTFAYSGSDNAVVGEGGGAGEGSGASR